MTGWKASPGLLHHHPKPPDHQRWRILLPLSREVTVHEHASIWRFLNDVLDGSLTVRLTIATGFYTCLLTWYEADNLFVAHDGATLDVDTILESNPAKYRNQWYRYHNLKTAPDGTPIITDRMVETFHRSPKGGRYFAIFAVQPAVSTNGWELSAIRPSYCRSAGRGQA